MGIALRAEAAEADLQDGDVTSLLDQYVALLEQQCFEDWADLFVDNCRYRVFALDFYAYEPLTPLLQLSGRSSLGTFVRTTDDEQLSNRQVCSHPSWVVRVDGDLEVRTNFVIHRSTANGQVKQFAVGQYQDVLTRSAGRLRFRQRDVVIDASGAPENISVPL